MTKRDKIPPGERWTRRACVAKDGVVFTLLAQLASPALAAEPVFGTWTGVFAQADLSPDGNGLRLWLDAHARTTGATSLAIVRPALGFELGKGAQLYAGYAWIPQVTDGGWSTEQRIWEQALFSGRAGGVGWTVRPRLEQRFFPGQSEIGHRVRLFGRAGLPLRDALSLSLWDEVFVGLNETGATVAGFDQNRLFVGPAIPLGDGSRFELGYLNAYLVRPTGNTLQHVVSTAVFASF